MISISVSWCTRTPPRQPQGAGLFPRGGDGLLSLAADALWPRPHQLFPGAKLLKRNCTNATTLKNIRSHRRDVPRKLLLLLYVITENITDGDYSELYEDYLTPEERLEDHWISLNAILTDCGMPTLDPRNAMDWLVLYAITASEESMSERMSQVIEALFQDIQ